MLLGFLGKISPSWWFMNRYMITSICFVRQGTTLSPSKMSKLILFVYDFFFYNIDGDCWMDVFNLGSMNNMPGLMSQMPPLSVAIDDDLSAILFSNSTSVSSLCCSLLYQKSITILYRGCSLVTYILPNLFQAVPFNSMQNGGFHMKQEPFGWLMKSSGIA